MEVEDTRELFTIAKEVSTVVGTMVFFFFGTCSSQDSHLPLLLLRRLSTPNCVQ